MAMTRHSSVSNLRPRWPSSAPTPLCSINSSPTKLPRKQHVSYTNGRKSCLVIPCPMPTCRSPRGDLTTRPVREASQINRTIITYHSFLLVGGFLRNDSELVLLYQN